MIIPAHNAHLTSIQTAAVAADPAIGITGSGPVTRWSGDAQAYIDEDTTDFVDAGQRVTVYDTIVGLPSNLPVKPNNEDILQLRYIDGTTEALIVRMVDRGTLFLGKLIVHCRRS